MDNEIRTYLESIVRIKKEDTPCGDFRVCKEELINCSDCPFDADNINNIKCELEIASN